MKVETPLFCSAMTASQHGDEALVDFGAQLGVAGQRLACRHEHAHQMLLQHLRLARRAALEERARIRPDVAREIGRVRAAPADRASGRRCGRHRPDRCRAGRRTSAPCGRTRRGTDARDRCGLPRRTRSPTPRSCSPETCRRDRASTASAIRRGSSRGSSPWSRPASASDAPRAGDRRAGPDAGPPCTKARSVPAASGARSIDSIAR